MFSQQCAEKVHTFIHCTIFSKMAVCEGGADFYDITHILINQNDAIIVIISTPRPQGGRGENHKSWRNPPIRGGWQEFSVHSVGTIEIDI
jgi:hypothetical protein